MFPGALRFPSLSTSSQQQEEKQASWCPLKVRRSVSTLQTQPSSQAGQASSRASLRDLPSALIIRTKLKLGQHLGQHKRSEQQQEEEAGAQGPLTSAPDVVRSRRAPVCFHSSPRFPSKVSPVFRIPINLFLCLPLNLNCGLMDDEV